MALSVDVRWKIDECAAYFDRMRLRGWCCHEQHDIVRLELVFPASGLVVPLSSFGQASPDVEANLGSHAARARFDEWVSGPAEVFGHPFNMRFTLADGSVQTGDDGLTNAAWGDPYFQSWENFWMHVAKFESGAVLEIGSRARSAITRRHRVPAHLEYVGLDIIDGPNVDVVGDAHALSTIFGERKFVAIFSTSVFEHLLMPWKVALEMNKVLSRGGVVYTSTHQTFPVHEEPWDFWRFSRTTWQAVFNPAMGFEIVEAVVGEPARIHPCRTSPVTRDMPASPAFLGSASIVRKVAETHLSWPVPLSVATGSMYPDGNLSTPPTTDRR